ncbi:unnamed protein product [Cladocopium goreaui]|uniref:C3H1-type domain-containing protein n=2 Tax=Cladocopium goreaui TaxID=2562237 RepID=A0A9P1CNJ8_9DINO|nr:unnamed protein product [Cladocopium goreaui]
MTTKQTQESLKCTQLCRHWASGTCFSGMGCSFAHSKAELRERPSLRATELCFRFAKGNCRKGQGCNFAHGHHELRSLAQLVPQKSMARSNKKEAAARASALACLDYPVDSATVQGMMALTDQLSQELTDQLSYLEMVEARFKLMEQMMPFLDAPPGLSPPTGSCGYLGYQSYHSEQTVAAEGEEQTPSFSSVSPVTAQGEPGEPVKIWL